MKSFATTALIIAALASGCGERADEQVYDTENNPRGFPNQAVVVLEQIESGKLPTYDLITQAFDDLYTNHPELLDNSNWRDVIKRLGGEFERRADDFAGRGIEYFNQAAGYYILAAFARPDRTDLVEKSRLFDGWSAAMRNLNAVPSGSDSLNTLAGITGVTRELMLGDSLQQVFARRYVIDSYLEPVATDSAVSALPKPDQAFLAWLGLAGLDQYEPKLAFIDPPIHLISARLAPVRPNLRLEVYFQTTDSISSDWRIALLGADSRGDTIMIQPDPPVSEWAPGDVHIVSREIKYIDDAGLSLGLFLDDEEKRRWCRSPEGDGPVGIIQAPPTP